MPYTINETNRTLIDPDGEVILTAGREQDMVYLNAIKEIGNGGVGEAPVIIFASDMQSYVSGAGKVSLMLTGVESKVPAAAAVKTAVSNGIAVAGNWAMEGTASTGELVSGIGTHTTYAEDNGEYIMASTGYDPVAGSWPTFYSVAHTTREGSFIIQIGGLALEEIGTSGQYYVKHVTVALNPANVNPDLNILASSTESVYLTVGNNSLGTFEMYVNGSSITLPETLDQIGGLLLRVNAESIEVLSVAQAVLATLTLAGAQTVTVAGKTENEVLSYAVTAGTLNFSGVLETFPSIYEATVSEATPPIGSVAGQVWRVTVGGTYKGVVYQAGDLVTI